MRDGPYREDQPAEAPRVFRATPWEVTKAGALTTFCVMVTAAVAYRIAEGHGDWKGWGLLAVFAAASVILAWVTSLKARTRVVLGDETISAVTTTKTVELRWREVATVQHLVVNGSVSYVLRSAAGEQITVDDSLGRFDEAVTLLRERLGPLPSDPA